MVIGFLMMTFDYTPRLLKILKILNFVNKITLKFELN